MGKVNVYTSVDEEKIITQVEYNQDLDYWDGHNFQNGGASRHLGLAQLADGRFVLIHGSDWQGSRSYAVIASLAECVQEIMRSDNEQVLDDYPELQEYYDEHIVQKPVSKTFSVRVRNDIEPGDLDKKLDDMMSTIQAWLEE